MKKAFKLFHHNFESKDGTRSLSIIICRRFYLPKINFKFNVERVLPNLIVFSFIVFNLEVLSIGYLWGVE